MVLTYTWFQNTVGDFIEVGTGPVFETIEWDFMYGVQVTDEWGCGGIIYTTDCTLQNNMTSIRMSPFSATQGSQILNTHFINNAPYIDAMTAASNDYIQIKLTRAGTGTGNVETYGILMFDSFGFEINENHLETTADTDFTRGLVIIDSYVQSFSISHSLSKGTIQLAF